MPLYKADGTSIATDGAYSLEVNSIDGLLYWYVDGKKTGTGVDIGHESSMDVSGVVSFYQSVVRDAANYVDGLGTDYVHYIEINDQHYDSNYRYGGKIMEALYNTGLFDKVIFLGDNTDSRDLTQLAHWESDYHNVIPNSLAVTGNHDSMWEEQAPEFCAAWKTDVADKMTGVVFDAQASSEYKAYFYYDNADYKIRLIFINPSSGGSNQSAWFKSTIASVPADWTFFVLSHECQVPFVTEYGTSGASAVLGESIGVYLAMDKRFGGIFCGHHHNDISAFLYGYLHQDTFLTDSTKAAGGYNSSWILPTRSNADDTAQAITIISINPTTKNVKFYRIGQVDTSMVNWNNKRREYTYGDTPSGVLENTWAGSGGQLSSQNGAKLWLTPQAVDGTKTYYVYHADGTDINQSTSAYLFFEYDANGNFIGRSSYGTVISSKLIRAPISSNCVNVIKSSWYGDDFVLSTVNPYA